MKVLLTGATGFIGSHTAEMLVQQGHYVRCLVRNNADTTFLRTLGSSLALQVGALDNAADLTTAVTDVDAIIHCAGQIKVRDPREFFATNADGAYALLSAAAARGPNLRRFILVSSLAACGAALNNHLPPAPDFIFQPVSQYGLSKLKAEWIAQTFASSLPITIIRPSVVYGPRDVSTFTFFKAIHRGFLPLSQGGIGAASTIYVTDVAAALIKAITAEVPSGSAYFLEDGTTLNWRERYNQLAQHAPSRRKIPVPLPQWVVKSVALFSEYYGHLCGKPTLLNRDKFNELKQLYWVCDSATARRELGWEAEVNWLQGTKLAYEWYRQSGWL